MVYIVPCGVCVSVCGDGGKGGGQGLAGGRRGSLRAGFCLGLQVQSAEWRACLAAAPCPRALPSTPTNTHANLWPLPCGACAVGIEDVEDLLADLDQAFQKAAAAAAAAAGPAPAEAALPS